MLKKFFKLYLADMFPRKTEEFLGGNRPRSFIELEIRNATKRAFLCLNQGAF